MPDTCYSAKVPGRRSRSLAQRRLWYGNFILFAALVTGLIAPAHLIASPPIVLGDYDAELRNSQHVDAPQMVKRLLQLHANTYMWLIWHSPNDWEDLQTFLPLAEKAGIRVWVYLVPHSETALQNPRWPYSEPFRVDYVRWAQEIAKRSLEHSNLVGYVIDDFWANVQPGRFEPDYTCRMVEAGKAINPRLKFYPLMYYGQIDERFVGTMAPLVDGVVAAYPNDRAEIERALAFLNDDYEIPPNITIIYPWNTPSQIGNHGMLARTVNVLESQSAKITFDVQSDFKGPTTGYHFAQLRVDDLVVWEQDVASHSDHAVSVDISHAVVGKKKITLQFGLFDKKGVSNFGVCVRLSNLTATGLQITARDLNIDDGWESKSQGAFKATFTPRYTSPKKFHLPLIVMPSGSQAEYEKRFHEKATPERVAGRVAVALKLATERRIEGVVTYCLDKHESSKTFTAVANEFQNFLRSEGEEKAKGER